MREWRSLPGPLAAASASVALIAGWFLYNPHDLTTQQAITELVQFSTHILVLAAVSGFAAMATLEMLKRLLHLRGRFFLSEIGRLAGPDFLLLSILDRARQDVPWGWEAISRLDLPLEQLVAQVAHAVDGALEATAAPQSVDLWRGERPTMLLGLLLRDRGRSADDRLKAMEPTFLRAEAQAALDDLQVRVGNAWRWRLRGWSCLLATLFTSLALLFVPGPAAAKVAALGASIIFGGFFAGLFRDFVAVVERGRRT